MNIDFGWLGKAELEYIEDHILYDGFEVTHDGYTESGIRVHAVVDNRDWVSYPYVWRNAIMIKAN